MCDDAGHGGRPVPRGAVFSDEAQEFGFGRGIMLQVPGADDMLLYQPHHATAFDQA